MNNQKEKKVVITGWTVLRAVGILGVVAMIVSDIIMAVGGTAISDVLTDNMAMRIGLLPVFIILLTVNKKKNKENENPKDEVQK